MSKILITMNEQAQAAPDGHFHVTYRVDEHDCLDCAAALESLGHEVFFVNWNDLDERQFRRMFRDNDKRFVEPVPLEDMDAVWVYQMEGFYYDLCRFLDMVDVFADACPLVINHPATIRHNLSKGYLWELERAGVRVIPTYRVDETIVGRLAAGEPFVVKPLFGERGNGVILARTPADLPDITSGEAQYIAQEYAPSIGDGEKSLVFLGSRYQHAVLKRPAPGEFRCNESRGGKVEVYEPTASELAYADGVLRVYESFGCPVHYSRIDFIDTAQGPALMEAELLNPAAFANYSGKGRRFGRAVAKYVDRLLASSKLVRSQAQLRSTSGLIA
jgi:glutathione synthase/RimK-type ligase-like ATP-grasp enzyme